MIDTDYEPTAAEDEYDRRAVDEAWAEPGENIPGEVVWAELGPTDEEEPAESRAGRPPVALVPYELEFRPGARRALRKLPRKVQIRARRVIDELLDDPRPPGCKAPANRPGRHRVRFGDYRVIYLALEAVAPDRIRSVPSGRGRVRVHQRELGARGRVAGHRALAAGTGAGVRTRVSRPAAGVRRPHQP